MMYSNVCRQKARVRSAAVLKEQASRSCMRQQEEQHSRSTQLQPHKHLKLERFY